MDKLSRTVRFTLQLLYGLVSYCTALPLRVPSFGDRDTHRDSWRLRFVRSVEISSRRFQSPSAKVQVATLLGEVVRSTETRSSAVDRLKDELMDS